MSVGARAGILPLLTALMVANGANAGNLSPFSSVGVIANGAMVKAGLVGFEGRVWFANFAAHEYKPHRHPSASTSGQEAGQAARADCGGTGDRTCCARSEGAANLFTIPQDDDREAASTRRLARSKR